MTYAGPGRSGLDYLRCSYGSSRLVFRGPQRTLDTPYCAVLGGTETFGKFIAQPYPSLVEQITGARMLNFGCVNAGPDAFLEDETVLGAARRALQVVVQIPGATNLTNLFYTVHPRRNDRFLGATAALRTLYPDVDFTEFSFTRHLLQGLYRHGPKRFAKVAAVLQGTWLERMIGLVQRVEVPVLGLWLSENSPAGRAPLQGGQAPHLVTRGMLARLRPHVSAIIEVATSPPEGPDGTEGMVFDPMDRAAAMELSGPLAHDRAAAALVPFLAGNPQTRDEFRPEYGRSRP